LPGPQTAALWSEAEIVKNPGRQPRRTPGALATSEMGAYSPNQPSGWFDWVRPIFGSAGLPGLGASRRRRSSLPRFRRGHASRRRGLIGPRPAPLRHAAASANRAPRSRSGDAFGRRGNSATGHQLVLPPAKPYSRAGGGGVAPRQVGTTRTGRNGTGAGGAVGSNAGPRTGNAGLPARRHGGQDRLRLRFTGPDHRGRREGGRRLTFQALQTR